MKYKIGRGGVEREVFAKPLITPRPGLAADVVLDQRKRGQDWKNGRVNKNCTFSLYQPPAEIFNDEYRKQAGVRKNYNGYRVTWKADQGYKKYTGNMPITCD